MNQKFKQIHQIANLLLQYVENYHIILQCEVIHVHDLGARGQHLDAQNAKNNLTQFPLGNEYQLITSPAGRVIFMTSALRGLLGEDIAGRNLNDLLPDVHVAGLISAAAGGKPYKFRGSICGVAVSCEMEPREGDLVINVIPASPIGVPSIGASTAQLLSREMNINLGTMFISLETYKKKLPPELQDKTELAVMGRGMYQMMRLSRNLLDTSLYESGELVLHKKMHDLQELCRKIADEVSDVCVKIGIDFELVTTTDDTTAFFDEERIERVIMNLICNSMQYTRDGNKITMSVAQRGENVFVKIFDRGVGISAEMLPYIFTKHARGNAASPSTIGGVGFGFAVAKAVATLHGGTCIVTSTRDVGTSVTVSFPRNLHKNAGFSAPRQPDYAGGRDHILLELSTVLPLEFY